MLRQLSEHGHTVETLSTRVPLQTVLCSMLMHSSTDIAVWDAWCALFLHQSNVEDAVGHARVCWLRAVLFAQCALLCWKLTF
jgi:hypothetical protein